MIHGRIFGSAKTITPHDTNANVFDSLWVGGVGNIKLETANGDTVTVLAVPAGTLLPLRVVLVYNTDTTASSILGLV